MSVLEQIIIFILFLGPLVFFHELGHFLFARFFGVRVEVFSIGFGPKVLKKTWGDTEYAVSLIPLGGYVKMFGDDPTKKDEIPEEDRSKSFTHKGKWARFWIVFGGPLANFIMAYAIFFSLAVLGEKVPEVKIGHVQPDTVFYEKGVRTGDVINKVNGKSIGSLSDVAMEEKSSVETITVNRNGKSVSMDVNLGIKAFFTEMSKHPPLLEALFVHKSGKEYVVKSSSGDPLALQNMAAGEYQLENTLDSSDIISLSLSENFLQELRDKSFYPVELLVKKANPDYPAFKAGIRPGDVITRVDGTEVLRFENLRSQVESTSSASLKVTVLRQGEEQTFSMTPETQVFNGQEKKIIGVENSLKYVPMKFVVTESKGFFPAFYVAGLRTWDSIGKVAAGFKKLINREASMDDIGGPLAIGKVASDSLSLSLSMFFVFMALVSINLGLINLFPIPVLDGGHILFIFFEIINRGPLSRRKMEIAQQVGLSLLLILMFFALKNDIRNFLS